MDRAQWLKNLVEEERQMEESGMVDVGEATPVNMNQTLFEETIEYLNDIKAVLSESSAAFNQYKATPLGSIKIYGISNTQSDFMLFRNGYKLIFSMSAPGKIHVNFNQVGKHFSNLSAVQSEPNDTGKDTLQAQWGAFGEVNWYFNGKQIHLDYLARFYLTRFIKESAK